MEALKLPELAPENEACSTKEEHINLRISANDKKKIQAKAVRAGLKTGEYVRRSALKKRIVERVPAELRRQISAVGNNLNQLARLANAGRLSGVGVEALNELVNRLLQTLK